MNATRLVQAFAGSVFGGSTETQGRRPPPREARRQRIVGGGAAEALEARRLFASASFSSGTFTLNADNTSETIYVWRRIEISPTRPP